MPRVSRLAAPPKGTILDSSGRPFARRADYAGGSAHRAADRFSQELARFNPALGSADGDWLRERDTTVARIHYMAQNNGWASGLMTRYVDQMVGAQFRLSVRPDYKALGISAEAAREWSRAVEAKFRTWANDPRRYCDAAERSNVSGLMGLGMRHRMLDGEALAVSHWIERPNFPWATCLQIVDPDRLSNPNGGWDTDVLRGGVAINAFGAPQGYWIRNAHPGEAWSAVRNRDAFKWTYVARKVPGLERQRVLHFFEPERAGQTRGKPILGPVLEKLKMLDHYERVEMQAALTNAIFAAFIESPFDPDGVAQSLQGTDTYEDARADFYEKSAITLDGQVLPALFSGDQVRFQTATRPNTGFADFEKAVLRYVAAASGYSYEQLAQDWSSTNYSSARAALLEAWKFLTARSLAFADGFATPFYALWLEESMDKGLVETPAGAPAFWDMPAAWTRCKWRIPPRGWVDPVKEAQGAVLRMEAGLSTLEAEADLYGTDDWEEILEQLAAEKAERERLGLPQPGGAMQASFAGPGAGPGPGDPDDDDRREKQQQGH